MPAAPTILRASPTAAGKAAAPSKANVAAVVPIAASRDIKIPGHNTISSGVDQRTGRPSVNLVVDPPNGAKIMGGSDYPAFNQVLLETVMATIPTNNPAAMPNRAAAASIALAAFKPTDELEGLLAAQAVALHHGALECLRRAILPDQHPDIASKLRRDAANLCRAMADMLDSLDRRRGKSPQTIRIERVTVNEGGRANIVGTVQPKQGSGI